MEESHDASDESGLLKERHNPTLKGIFTKHTCKLVFQGNAMWISIGLTILCIVSLTIFSNIGLIEFLEKITALNISAFPSILGFCIGGYALIIGFSHRDVLHKMSEPLGKKKSYMSYFQILSCVFAISIIFQIATLFISFVISYAINLDLSVNAYLANIMNGLAILIICFLSSFSLLLIYYIVKNTFIFGQMMHFCIRQEVIEKKGHSKKNIRKTK